MANPHSEERMKLILEQMEVKSGQTNEEDKESDEIDEVSMMYYGCNCTKNSMCRTNKCICYLRDNKCIESCHGTKYSKYRNL